MSTPISARLGMRWYLIKHHFRVWRENLHIIIQARSFRVGGGWTGDTTDRMSWLQADTLRGKWQNNFATPGDGKFYIVRFDPEKASIPVPVKDWWWRTMPKSIGGWVLAIMLGAMGAVIWACVICFIKTEL